MRKLPLLEYKINGEYSHCTVDITLGDNHVITLDTGSEYIDSVEEDLANMFAEMIRQVLPHSEYLSEIKRD